MLVSSVLRCFYWIDARFELSLLYQSLLMILVQLILLRVALQHRPPLPPPTPFSTKPHSSRPYNFWQWPSQTPYWHFLLSFFGALSLLTLLFGRFESYTNLLGMLGLGIEATLPLPQLLKNQKEKSCKGFRVSVLAAWLIGDVTKMVYFFNAQSVGPLFKVCAGMQMCLDFALGVQFAVYGEGTPVSEIGIGSAVEMN